MPFHEQHHRATLDVSHRPLLRDDDQTLTDSNGRNLSLADFKGKTVVLEWTSHECPYVGKHYRGNNMQALQKKWTGQGVVWLSVISSAPGQPGYVSPQEANKLTADRSAAPLGIGTIRTAARHGSRLGSPSRGGHRRDRWLAVGASGKSRERAYIPVEFSKVKRPPTFP